MYLDLTVSVYLITNVPRFDSLCLLVTIVPRSDSLYLLVTNVPRSDSLYLLVTNVPRPDSLYLCVHQVPTQHNATLATYSGLSGLGLPVNTAVSSLFNTQVSSRLYFVVVVVDIHHDMQAGVPIRFS